MREPKVGDKVEVITKPEYHQYQYDVGEIFTVYKVTEGCAYSDNIRCIRLYRVKLIPNKNLIGGKLL